jgi:tetratricopeptide (TPR) repeat protein
VEPVPPERFDDATALLEHHGDDVSAVLKGGDIAQRAGRKEDALRLFAHALESYHQHENYLKAIAVGKQMLRVDERYLPAHRRLAELYREIGLLRDAGEHEATLARLEGAAHEESPKV